MFWMAGWLFDIPMFYRSVALAGDKDRRKMKPDLHFCDLRTRPLPSYSHAWWEKGGEGLATADELLSLDCSKVHALFIRSPPFRNTICHR